MNDSHKAFSLNLFSGQQQFENFRSCDKIFPTTPIHRSGPIFEFGNAPRDLPETYLYEGSTKNLINFLDEVDTTGMLVIKNDTIIYEDYWHGYTRQTRCLSMSVAKSFVSALVGIALDEECFSSIEDPITQYVPELNGSGYDGVRIKDILQMSSGVRWNEDYSDPDSDINRLGDALDSGKSLDDCASACVAELPPGSYNRYVSMDTQVLGMLLVRTTGESISKYLETRIWKKLGMECDAYWLVGDDGMEMAFFGLNVTLRDYARFGRLYLLGGNWQGEQIVPAQWVADSVTPDAPHLQPGVNDLSEEEMGYGMQWWLPNNPDGEYLAIGVYGQFIYVYPREQLVIAKTSANRNYGLTDEEPSWRELEHIKMFRAIAQQLK
jgi:CubicO group peptidase (beta-lactamase class C family)